MNCSDSYAEKQAQHHVDQVKALQEILNERYYLLINSACSGPTKANIFIPRGNDFRSLEAGIIGGHRIFGEASFEGRDFFSHSFVTVDYGVEPTNRGCWNKINFVIKAKDLDEAKKMLAQFNK